MVSAANPEPAPVVCPHAACCPGCALITRSPAERRAAKEARLAEALGPYATLVLRPLPLQGAEHEAGYRTRAKLAVAAGPRLGLYARGSHEVLDLPGCLVLTPRLAAAASALRALFAAPPPAAAPVLRAEGDGAGRLRAVDLREVESEAGFAVLLTLVLRTPAPEEHALAAAREALLAAVPGLAALSLRLHDGHAPGLLGGPPRLLHGEAWLPDRLAPGEPSVLVAAGSFVQAHRAQAARLQAAALAALGDVAGQNVLDVYAGSGALGLALAARGARPLLVEGFAPAAAAAEEAARRQGLAVTVESAPAERALPALRRAGRRFDAAVANPPRAGLARRAREALAGLVDGPLVLVSCEPATLARDLAHFAELGFRCERLEPWDLMPLTDQVESLAVLRRGPPPPLTVLHAERDFLAVAKPAGLPTLPLPEHGDSLLARVRALRGRAQAVAVTKLERSASGVCLFASAPEHATTLERALSAAGAEQQSLALVRGVARAGGRLGGGAARYRRREVVGGHALLEIVHAAGASPPLRRLLRAIGEPVLGDERHGHAPSNRHAFERTGLDRAFLHVGKLSLRHPASGAPLVLEAPLAPDLAAVLARLGAPR